MLKKLMDILCCPKCYSDLSWKIKKQNNQNIVEGEAVCINCDGIYPIRDNIAVFLTDILERNDLWEQIESNLAKYLKGNPDIYKNLMESSIESLKPTDIFFRSLMKYDELDFEESYRLKAIANKGIYTPEYLECFDSQLNFFKKINLNSEFVVDLASGRGELAKKLTELTDSHVLFTDFSPRILQKDKKELNYLGITNFSLIVFDARRTPFKDKSVNILTTNVGLSNIEDPGYVFKELRRILLGEMYAIHFFIPEEDLLHKDYVDKGFITKYIYEKELINDLTSTGFEVQILNICYSPTKPTPRGKIIQAGIDRIPVSDTTVKWCIIHAK